MNICVAGWYFHKPLLDVLALCDYPVFYACHKDPPASISHERYLVLPNRGLEFGCYQHYLSEHWKGGNVLFLHDDNEVTDAALDQIAALSQDQVFLFGGEADVEANGRAHGRAFFCSDRLLARLRDDGGFWYDEGPQTSVAVPATRADVPDYHNLGIGTFVAWLKALPGEFHVAQPLVIPGLKTGYRGRL